METRNLIAENYFELIKNLNVDVKLELISRISDSLREQTVSRDDSWKDLFGAYNSGQSAEEIIDDLRSSRFTKCQIESL